MTLDVQAALETLRAGEETARRALVDALARERTSVVVPVLLRAVGDESWSVRQAALAHLQAFPPDTLLPVLDAALRDGEDATARNAAMELYVHLGTPAVHALLGLLRDEDDDVRHFSAMMLGALHDRRAVEPLVAALADPEPNVRHAAAASLGQIGADEAVGALVGALGREPWLQYPAIHALGEIGDPSAVPALVALLDDELLRGVTLDALGRLAGREALGAIVPHLYDPEPSVRNAAVRAVVAVEQRATAAGDSLDPEVQAALRRDDLVDHLLLMLSDDDEQNRRTAAITLGWLKEPRAERPLIEHLDEPALHEHVTHALVSIGFRDPEAYRAGLEHPDETVRQGTLRCLAFIAPPDGLTLAAPLVHDPSAAVREEAVAALGRLGGDDDATAMLLFELLSDESELIQEAAVDALARLPEGRVMPLLVQALGHDDVSVRVRAAKTLGRLGEASVAAAPALMALAHDPHESVRRAALHALGEIDAPDVGALLREALRDESGLVRQQAALSLGKRQDPESIHDLLPLLEHPDPRTRFVALRALGQVRHPDAVPAVLRVLDDARQELRFAAVEALGALRSTVAVRPLVAVLRDPDRNLRRAAAESLGAIGDPEAAPALILALEDDHWSVRCAVAAALGRTGSAKAVAALVGRLEDDDPTVRRAVLGALGAIGDARAARRLVLALDDPGLQTTAFEALERLGTAALPDVERGFGTASVEARRLLVSLAGRLDDRRARRLLLGALADDSSAVRAEAALALGDGGALEALRPLTDLKASDPAREVRQAATRALRQLAPR